MFSNDEELKRFLERVDDFFVTLIDQDNEYDEASQDRSNTPFENKVVGHQII